MISASAQETTKAAKIEELLKLTNVAATSQQMFSQMRAMLGKQAGAAGASEQTKAAAAQAADKVMAQVQELLSWDKMKPEYVRLYDEVYSDEEITGILAFYKSPAGQAFVNKMPLLITKTMEIAQRRMAAVMPELQRITREAAEERKKAEPK